jgi:hypothetical protein
MAGRIGSVLFRWYMGAIILIERTEFVILTAFQLKSNLSEPVTLACLLTHRGGWRPAVEPYPAVHTGYGLVLYRHFRSVSRPDEPHLLMPRRV